MNNTILWAPRAVCIHSILPLKLDLQHSPSLMNKLRITRNEIVDFFNISRPSTIIFVSCDVSN